MRQMLAKVSKKLTFLQQLQAQIAAGPQMRAVASAAAAVGVHRATPYRWRATDPDFAERWAAIEAQSWAAWKLRYQAELVERNRKKAARWAELRPQFQQLAANARAALARKRRGVA